MLVASESETIFNAVGRLFVFRQQFQRENVGEIVSAVATYPADLSHDVEFVGKAQLPHRSRFPGFTNRFLERIVVGTRPEYLISPRSKMPSGRRKREGDRETFGPRRCAEVPNSPWNHFETEVSAARHISRCKFSDGSEICDEFSPSLFDPLSTTTLLNYTRKRRGSRCNSKSMYRNARRAPGDHDGCFAKIRADEQVLQKCCTPYMVYYQFHTKYYKCAWRRQKERTLCIKIQCVANSILRYYRV